MGDGSPEADFAVASSAAEQVFEGKGAVSGISIGTVYRYDASAPEVRRQEIGAGEIETELELLSNAVQRAERELETVRVLADQSLDADGKGIIEVQSMMLQDDELLQAVRDWIRRERESAGAAVKAVLRTHRERLADSDTEYLRDRVEDINDLERRLLRSLQRGRVAASIGADSVVIAKSLAATDVLRFGRHGMLGCVTEEGGTTSHVSIIAKALGLPTLVGVDSISASVSSGDPVILDGERGRLIVHPGPSTVETYRKRQAEHEKHVRPGGEMDDQPAVTTDGQTVPLRANVELEEEFDLLDRFGADGIGLLRTEMLFLSKGGGPLSGEQQLQLYRKAAEATGDEGATVRLLDPGGDTRLPRRASGPKEDNPFLGWRGIRVLLDRPDELLRPQLRALLQANAHGHLRVLLPMVGDLAEVRRVRSIMEEEETRLAAEDIVHDPDLPLGIMVEVPAAALQARAFAEEVDFFSVGTNDLTQYVLAVDRGNDWVSSRYDALHPAVLGLIQRTAAAAQATGSPIEVCGESAGDLQAVPILLGLGVDVLSASPHSLPSIRRAIRQMALEDAQALADRALAVTDADTVRRLARTWLSRHVSLDDDPPHAPGA